MALRSLNAVDAKINNNVIIAILKSEPMDKRINDIKNVPGSRFEIQQAFWKPCLVNLIT